MTLFLIEEGQVCLTSFTQAFPFTSLEGVKLRVFYQKYPRNFTGTIFFFTHNRIKSVIFPRIMAASRVKRLHSFTSHLSD